MSRHNRPHIPGAAFHITTRTQGHEKWFTEHIRPRVAEIIIDGFATSDAQLIAGTIMPNHLHIVLRQGMRTLGWTMQPVLRRIALLVQRSNGVQGHVFERPFRAHHCDNAGYLRRAIVYTNVNPQRAGLCDRDGKYEQSSHERFLRGIDGPGCKAIADVLPLFCDTAPASLDDACENYRRYVIWRLAKDEAEARGDLYMLPEPPARHGDGYFVQHFVAWKLGEPPQSRDLRDKARDLLIDVAPIFELGQLKGRTLSRAASNARRQLIAALLQAGYRCKSIAAFLQISDSTVSAIASEMRYSILGLNRIPEGGPQ